MKVMKKLVETMVKLKTGIYHTNDLSPADKKKNEDALNDVRTILKPKDGKIGINYDVPDPKVSTKY